MLDTKSPIPLYFQLQEIIRARIENGEWQPGQQLPPEAELCEEFGLSRGTVRQALTDLVREGLLCRKRGKGSFVTDQKIAQDIMNLAGGFTSYAKDVLGVELGSRLVSVRVIPANKIIAEKLQLPEGSDIVEIRKVKLTGDRPYFVVTSLVPRAACPGLEQEDHSSGSLFDVLKEKYGLKAALVKGWFEPTLVSKDDACILEMEEGSPAMIFERIRYDASNRPFIVSVHVIRGDMCRLTFQINDSKSR